MSSRISSGFFDHFLGTAIWTYGYPTKVISILGVSATHTRLLDIKLIENLLARIRAHVAIQFNVMACQNTTKD